MIYKFTQGELRAGAGLQRQCRTPCPHLGCQRRQILDKHVRIKHRVLVLWPGVSCVVATAPMLVVEVVMVRLEVVVSRRVVMDVRL